MRLEELKEYYKTYAAITRLAGMGMNNHQYWKKIGYIPYPTQLVIEKKTKGKFKANLDDALPKSVE